MRIKKKGITVHNVEKSLTKKTHGYTDQSPRFGA